MDLIDSNLIVYASLPEHEKLRDYIRRSAPLVSIVGKIETLGYHNLSAGEQQYLNVFFSAATLLPISEKVAEEAIQLRQQRSMTLGDALIAGTAICHDLRIATHNISDFTWITGLNVFDPLSE